MLVCLICETGSYLMAACLTTYKPLVIHVRNVGLSVLEYFKLRADSKIRSKVPTPSKTSFEESQDSCVAFSESAKMKTEDINDIEHVVRYMNKAV